jgi:hypothetical protein
MRLEMLCMIELAGQQVTALRETDQLVELSAPEGYQFRSDDYLRFRIPELKPVAQLLQNSGS